VWAKAAVARLEGQDNFIIIIIIILAVSSSSSIAGR